MSIRWKLNERQQKFVREVGSVVLGVLIALGIGEIAESIRWQVRVSTSMAAVREELASNRAHFAERQLLGPCIDRKLREIGTVLAFARRTHRLPRISEIGKLPMPVFEVSAFEVARNEAVSLHMDSRLARDVAYAYEAFAMYPSRPGGLEHEAWRKLELLRDAPGPIDSDLLGTLLTAWADAREAAEISDLLAVQSEKLFESLKIPVKYHPDRAAMEEKAKNASVCKPLEVEFRPEDLPRKP